MRFQEGKAILAQAVTCRILADKFLHSCHADSQAAFSAQQSLMANQIPFPLPGFQQFGEKECGKELSCVRKRAYAARFPALHWIMCGC
jgi:hypothetical protein